MSSSEVNLPARMFRAGRLADLVFDPEEYLYYRYPCPPDYVLEQILPQGIRFPDQSVNRSKYSEPEDVLLPNYEGWGIAAFKVKDLPESYRTDEATLYEWRVVHKPLEDNYAHSEVQTFKNGNYTKKLQVSSTVKKWFRQILSERTVVIRQPEI